MKLNTNKILNPAAFCRYQKVVNTSSWNGNLLNDVQFIEAARKFAERVITEGGEDAPSMNGKWSVVYKAGPDGNWQTWRWIWNQPAGQGVPVAE